MTLGEFLKHQLGASGGNCSMLAADWCIELGHPDYATEWRNLTDDAEIERTCIDGLLPLWERGIGDALPPVVGELRTGDIGVVVILGSETGGVFTGERWAFHGRRGLIFAQVARCAVLKAWRP